MVSRSRCYSLRLSRKCGAHHDADRLEADTSDALFMRITGRAINFELKYSILSNTIRYDKVLVSQLVKAAGILSSTSITTQMNASVGIPCDSVELLQ